MKAIIRANRWFVLDERKLFPGDIIATSNSGKLSKAIRKATGGNHSHVAVYVGTVGICEAILPRARLVKAEHYLFTSDVTAFRVLRPKQPNPLNIRKLATEAEFYSWNLYSPMKAVGFKYSPAKLLAASDAQICSELVSVLFRRAGMSLCPSIPDSEVTPADICGSKVLKDVTRRCVRALEHQEANNKFALLFKEATSLKTLLKPVFSWISALLYSRSPLRSGWAKPMKDWNGGEFISFYLFSALPLIRCFYICGRQKLALTFMNAFRSRLSDESANAMFREMFTSKLDATRLDLKRDQSALTSEMKAFPEPWRTRFTNVIKVAIALKEYEIKLLERMLAIVSVQPSTK